MAKTKSTTPAEFKKFRTEHQAKVKKLIANQLQEHTDAIADAKKQAAEALAELKNNLKDGKAKK